MSTTQSVSVVNAASATEAVRYTCMRGKSARWRLCKPMHLVESTHAGGGLNFAIFTVCPALHQSILKFVEMLMLMCRLYMLIKHACGQRNLN